MTWPFGDGPIGVWLERRRAMAALRHSVAVERNLLALDEANPLSQAKAAAMIGDNVGARHYLELARRHIPAYVESSPDTLDTLLTLGDLNEAESLAATGKRRYPQRPEYGEAYATVAERRGDWAEAARRWTMARKRFPLRPLPRAAEIACLRRLGRLDQAGTMLRRAMGVLPEDVSIKLESGRLAEAHGDWAIALQRWLELAAIHPEGPIGAANALHQLGRTGEALTCLAEARSAWPLEPAIGVVAARIAANAGQVEEAIRGWADIRRRFPGDPGGYIEALRLLRTLNRLAEAEDVAALACEQFPDESWPLVEHALVAHLRQDWPKAAARWEAVRAAFPDREDGYRHGIEALENAGVAADAERLREEYRARHRG